MFTPFYFVTIEGVGYPRVALKSKMKSQWANSGSTWLDGEFSEDIVVMFMKAHAPVSQLFAAIILPIAKRIAFLIEYCCPMVQSFKQKSKLGGAV